MNRLFSFAFQKMANPTGVTIPITKRLQDRLLHWTNERRDKIAGGKLTYFKTALRMPTLVNAKTKNSLFRSAKMKNLSDL